MARQEWRPFLEEFSRLMLEDEKIRTALPESVLASGWLGFDPAPEEEIAELEARLRVHLPPSYRSFLETTNGWRNCGAFIYRLWPAREVAWFRQRHQEWIDAYNNPKYPLPPVADAEYYVYDGRQDPTLMRSEYLKTALEISDVGEDAILLLNPRTLTIQGEWEAWFFSDWLPGARRYRSFWDLMNGIRNEFIQIRHMR